MEILKYKHGYFHVNFAENMKFYNINIAKYINSYRNSVIFG